jgi:hypothetical protein
VDTARGGWFAACGLDSALFRFFGGRASQWPVRACLVRVRNCTAALQRFRPVWTSGSESPRWLVRSRRVLSGEPKTVCNPLKAPELGCGRPIAAEKFNVS